MLCHVLCRDRAGAQQRPLPRHERGAAEPARPSRSHRDADRETHRTHQGVSRREYIYALVFQDLAQKMCACSQTNG